MDPRDAMVGDHLINLKPGSLGLGALMGQGLVQGANPAIENRLHACRLLSPEVLSAFEIVHSAKLTLGDWFFGRFRVSFEPCPCGRYQSLIGIDRIRCQYMVM
jgi:hypothetical protein